MSDQIDKLFNAKLTNHSVAPSSQAWEKVAANLVKKNRGLIVFRWAAAILIPALIGALLWYNTRPGVELTAVNKTEKKTASAIKSEVREEKKDSIVNTRNPVKTKSSPVKKENKCELKQDDTKVRRSPKASSTTNIVANPVASAAPEVVAPSEDKSDAAVVDPPAVPGVAIAASEKPVTLEYTLPTIKADDDVPVEKPITVTIVLNDKHEKKGFQKMIDFARDAKNSEGPFATLRQAKEDLFAFNFKKEKNQK